MENTNIKYFDIEELDTEILYLATEEYEEGDEKLSLHLKRERNYRAVQKAKELFKRNHNGRLFCEICTFDFTKKYGDIGEGFIEAHHKKPISKMKQGDITRIDDFIMVCSNCHSMLHKGTDWISHEELKSRLND